ncbi:hypothetical protein Pla52n_12650 [Stieleria varia]|uniref:DUF6487 domain-containing protein n=1 Tax=Stieleria varia TaxID=2528005 RepID=A0A5C6B1U9_9BACT|nr:hypothetical protein Pla52n_12650 [Stieleria varia]
MKKRVCPKCGGEMIAGFLLEKNMPVLEVDLTPTEWVSIDPEYFDKHGFFQTKHIRDRRRVETHRCSECNFLESYAADASTAADQK